MVSGVDPIWLSATCQLLRALRGQRSQVAFARRLGFRSNVPAAWEGGHRVPNADELLRVCARVGVDGPAALTRFHPPAAGALSEGVGAWLSELRGRTAVGELAERSGCSPSQVRRWLSGSASPRVHQLLALLDALTGRAPDLVAELVDIAEVPALLARHTEGRTQRRLAFEHPWTAAVRVLIDAAPVPVEGAAAELARRVAQPVELIEDALGRLMEHRLVAQQDGWIVGSRSLTVDLRATAQDRRNLRAHWARVAADRVAADRGDLFSFSLMAVSRADLDRIRAVQRRSFREIRGIAAASEPPEVGALVVAQVACFDDDAQS